MKIHVRLFASYREAFERDELELEVPGGTTCTQIQTQLAAEQPVLERWGSVVRYGVNCRFVPPETPLTDGDELVLIPPVSGG
ncbi:MoaD/ThiS family protein [Gloeobacter kilaueensis]|uniref:Molybdopterin synthase sulfur carrier subunit n=1 Tax=Gloeobacter kilaueensis (strain ATCC BAA-2537 / CCAP 1431/1 / ULC 316 / JS1) TaxID=1183438 RepID=U5QLE4_GLOK1|nr:MoaD/ThiS family protein [Gloeobacter kilaueensis]AGY59708.1 molybdopterin converting factor, subunit 1 [Gloeobacter kilaueensis JS1]